MRFFNTAGPIQPDINYCIPPLERLDLDDVLELIRTRKYFVLHAPRQTGKDLGAAGTAGPAEQRRRGGFSLRVCECRRCSGSTRRYPEGHAGYSQ